MIPPTTPKIKHEISAGPAVVRYQAFEDGQGQFIRITVLDLSTMNSNHIDDLPVPFTVSLTKGGQA